MPLGQAKMQAILKEYEKLQEDNRRTMAQRRARVGEQAPAYFDYHNQIISLCMQHTRDTLYPDTTADSEAEYRQKLDELRLAKDRALTQAGFPADYLEPVYHCSKCRDTGYLETTQCDCLKQRIVRTLYAQSGIEHLLAEHNFDTLSYDYYEGADLDAFRTAVETATEMVAQFGTGENLLLYGTVGCGKSFLSGCIAKALMDRGVSVVYFSSAQLFDTIRQNNLYNGLEELYNYDLVIVDDLGAELTNSFVTTALFSFLNERILRKKSTIISTNLSLSDMKERYSDRIVSRIIQNFKLCKLSGPDIRIIKRLSTRK